MRPITLVLPYYCQPKMLAIQHGILAALPADIRAHLTVIVVDDGSPTQPAQLVPAGLASQQLYRILTDVPWNWLAARNLGMHHASTTWALLTDLDHAVPADTWRALMTEPLDEALVYRFAREEARSREPMKSHPNTWLLTRAMYDAVGGYDERLSGCYGTDAEFRDRVVEQARAIRFLTTPVVRYGSEEVADAETVAFPRGDYPQRRELLKRRAERQRLGKWRPLRLTFKWRHVQTLTATPELEAVS